VVTVKSTIFCYVLCYTCLIYSLTLKMKAVHSSEMLASFFRTTWCYIPEGGTLNIKRVSL
jgi:hypothetical protein